MAFFRVVQASLSAAACAMLSSLGIEDDSDLEMLLCGS